MHPNLLPYVGAPTAAGAEGCACTTAADANALRPGCVPGLDGAGRAVHRAGRGAEPPRPAGNPQLDLSSGLRLPTDRVPVTSSTPASVGRASHHPCPSSAPRSRVWRAASSFSMPSAMTVAPLARAKETTAL